MNKLAAILFVIILVVGVLCDCKGHIGPMPKSGNGVRVRRRASLDFNPCLALPPKFYQACIEGHLQPRGLFRRV